MDKLLHPCLHCALAALIEHREEHSLADSPEEVIIRLIEHLGDNIDHLNSAEDRQFYTTMVMMSATAAMNAVIDREWKNDQDENWQQARAAAGKGH